MTQKNHKLNETNSTIRYHNQQMSNSFNFSQIFQNQGRRLCRNLNNSVQYFKSPYMQTLPLKFPQNRIIRPHHQHHMLQQSNTPHKRNCIKVFGLKNQQSEQINWRQNKIKEAYKKTICSPNLNNYQFAQIFHSKSLQNYCQKNSSVSPSKQSKKLFHDKIIKQSMKNPILFGEQVHKKQYIQVKNQTNKQFPKRINNQEIKSSFEWNINKSLSKQRFNNKYFTNNNSLQKKTETIKIIPSKPKLCAPKQIIKMQKPKNYKDLYILRKAK